MNDFMEILEKAIGGSLICFGTYFFYYGLKKAKWSGFDIYIVIRRFSVSLLCIMLGVLILLEYANFLGS